ncbi:hypothetical protein ACHAW6_002661 [Cyclotella cf. meneghiniana]
MNGNEVPMSKFKGEVLCVLYDEYNSKGFKILAFPCNQFGGQEPGTHDEILEFVEKNFQAKDKFTWFEKGHVNGKETREVYSFLKQSLPAEDGTKDIRWNFAKFLVDHEGTPYKRFGPKTNPEEMKVDIEDLLAKRNAVGK